MPHRPSVLSQGHAAFQALHALNSPEPKLHQSLHYSSLSQIPTVTGYQDEFGGHICQLATMPGVKDLTIEYIYHDFSRRKILVHGAGGITVCDILAAAEQLMVVDLERSTSNDPYGQTAERRRDAVPPCQRRETYFDGLRKVYGEAGLLRSDLRDEVWEFRFGPGQVTRKS